MYSTHEEDGCVVGSAAVRFSAVELAGGGAETIAAVTETATKSVERKLCAIVDIVK